MNSMAIQVPINLATEPFRRDRPVLVASAALGLLLAILLGFEAKTIVSQRHEGAEIHVTINRLNNELRSITAQQARLNALLRKPENAEVMERSLFLNALIDRKAISWTKLFADLEKVVPYNVRLVSVRLPEVDSDNRVLLDMVLGAKERPELVETVSHLEASPQFGPTSVQSTTPPSQTDPFYRYHVVVSYAQKL
jgi:type IV pilus assembly protein PilN